MASDPLITEGLIRRTYAFVDQLEPGPSRRLWAAIMLTPHYDVCRSILAGRPVLCSRLEGSAMRRAMRGSPLPDPDSYVTITAEMLDAVAEGGAF